MEKFDCFAYGALANGSNKKALRDDYKEIFGTQKEC